ncbi:hypothetical protein MJG53_018474 [Ovis ammon polii x Ovis aries]|uniref:Uncharacterized protein n=1 Tax=Ovis ammon polii x Ovis aries TaxID=2918886 RepID=A0ACB9U3V4_9CETA|nr:hypothetical protein MJG53_018474 [Ovis ammon polii x Ovis aries]
MESRASACEVSPVGRGGGGAAPTWVKDPPGEQPSRAGRVRAPETSVPGSAKLTRATFPMKGRPPSVLGTLPLFVVPRTWQQDAEVGAVWKLHASSLRPAGCDVHSHTQLQRLSDFLLSFRWAGSLDGEAVVPLSEEKPPQGFRIKSQKRGCFGEKQEQFPGFPDSTAGPPFSSGAVCFGVGLAELSLLGKPLFRQLLLGTAAMMGIKGTRRGRDL